MSPRVAIPAATVVLAVVAVLLLRGGDTPYTVQIEFRNLSGLRKNSDVKVGGVPGGVITKVSLTDRDTARATVQLDDGIRIGDGARAAVRPVNLLGEKYIDLTVGDLQRPERSGASIPLSRTSAPVELDDVLNTLRPNTRAALRVVINEAGVAMAGRGSDFNRLLDELPPAIDQTRRVVAALGEDTRQLQQMVERGDRVLAAITGKRDDLTRLVREAGSALQITADRRGDLGTTVAEAEPTLRQLRTTLTDLEGTANALVPTSRALRTTIQPLRDTLAATPAFVDDAQPLLETAQRVSPDLTRLGLRSTPVLTRLRPTAARLNRFGQQLAPTTGTLDQGGALDGLLGLMNNWVLTIQNSDGLGHVFRLRPQVDETALTALFEGLEDDATRGTQARRRRPAPPAANQQRPAAARTTPPAATTPVPQQSAVPGPTATVAPAAGGLLPDLLGTLGDTLRGSPPSADTTDDLLDYLLGD